MDSVDEHPALQDVGLESLGKDTKNKYRVLVRMETQSGKGGPKTKAPTRAQAYALHKKSTVAWHMKHIFFLHQPPRRACSRLGVFMHVACSCKISAGISNRVMARLVDSHGGAMGVRGQYRELSRCEHEGRTCHEPSITQQRVLIRRRPWFRASVVSQVV